MNRCERCGSYAINNESHGRDGTDRHLCDVCYWRKRAEKDSMTWQPIETAPRDGTAILVCQATEAGNSTIRLTKNFGLFVQRGVWWGKEIDGKWIVYCSLPIDPVCFFNPTHWMLVPDTPNVLK